MIIFNSFIYRILFFSFYVFYSINRRWSETKKNELRSVPSNEISQLDLRYKIWMNKIKCRFEWKKKQTNKLQPIISIWTKKNKFFFFLVKSVWWVCWKYSILKFNYKMICFKCHCILSFMIFWMFLISMKYFLFLCTCFFRIIF